MAGVVFAALTLMVCFTLVPSIFAQSRRNVKTTVGNDDGEVLNVAVTRAAGANVPLTITNFALYENGVEQKIKNFTRDASPAKIVLLVDNSQTIRADVEKLKAAVREFAYEIYDGDQLFVLAYDEKAEIVQEWTDDAKKIETSLASIRKKGNPFMFDALHDGVNQVLLPLMPGARKTVVVLISDGLDRGSKTTFDNVLSELQRDNVTVYALQLPDRTGGAYRRDQPKASEALQKLVEGTGGALFPFADPQAGAKAICDELRNNRYLISYDPLNTSSYDARRVFLTADEGITVRSKLAQPPNVK
jgi:Ca-activated chloride channel family protein